MQKLLFFFVFFLVFFFFGGGGGGGGFQFIETAFQSYLCCVQTLLLFLFWDCCGVFGGGPSSLLKQRFNPTYAVGRHCFISSDKIKVDHAWHCSASCNCIN